MFGGLPTPSGIAGDFATSVFGGVRTYNAKDVQVIVGVVPMIGLAPDSFVKVERDKQTFRKIVGVNGEITRVMERDLTGSMEITLMQTSESNAILSTLQYADELGKFGIVPIMIMDLSGGTTCLSLAAWLKKPPDTEFQKGLTVRRWTFDLATIDILNVGNVLGGLF